MLKVKIILLLICYLICNCNAITKDQLYPFGIQDDHLRQDSDDVSSPEVQLSIPIVFYENIYKSIFVNDNGILSFLTEVPSFFNAQFPLTYPIIAPMYSDIDTRGNGSVYYRETKSAELLQRASDDIVRHFSNANSFRAQSLFIATWDNVGHYNSKPSPTNTVQVVIASNGNESFAFFFYPENGIQWIQGDGKISNLPDARTQIGFMSGDGRVYTLVGSGTDQVRNFDRMSNVNRPGIWAFHIGNTGPTNIKLPDINGAESLVRTGIETCVNTQLPCPPSASCIDYSNGFCCSCIEGYIGNGRNCLSKNSPLRINGKVNGLVNDIKIENVDLHAYVVTQEGRQYTAISRIPPNIGYDLQVLSTIGGIIGWQFATPKSNASNGFMLTGGVFNYSAEITFPQTSHSVLITANFLGLDVFNFLRAAIDIKGTLPSIPFGSKIEIQDFEEDYTRVAPGKIRSHSTRSFSYGESSLSVPMTIDQTFVFNECTFAPHNEELSTLKLKVARNYIVYDSREQIVRYASNSKISPLSMADPCIEGKSKCGENSNCVVEGDSFKCICDRGFDYLRGSSPTDITVCTDIDECALGRHNCHMFADCTNIPGSFTCKCKSGYLGNGYNCQKELRCSDLTCGENAECIHLPRRNPECKCKAGFSGNGFECLSNPNADEDCRYMKICDANAECLANPSSQRYQCFCRRGFRGDGFICTHETESCDLTDNCHRDAECVYDSRNNDYYCLCNPGYVGDGYNCVSEETYQSCSTLNNCHPYAECIYDPRYARHQCKCKAGYTGDGYQCKRAEEVSCSSGADVCSPNANCLFDEVLKKDICKCKERYTGDGIICKPIDECNADADSCDRNAKCTYNRAASKYECVCNEGYTGNGKTCTTGRDVACNFANNCNANASCAFDLNTLKYKCQCNVGFKGDGYKCTKLILSCNIINNCDVKAECKYNYDAEGYRCQCINGFVGDGFTCRPLRTCREDYSLCDRNAECLYSESLQSYTCNCRYGFVGDGFQCSLAPRFEGDYIMFTQGMSLLRIPFQPTKTDRGQLILTKPYQIPVGLDTDCLKGQVYWTDVAHGSINRVFYNGSTVETIISENSSPEGIAIDWASRNLYWTDSLNDAIKVARLDGLMQKTLITDGLIDPRGIAVHPGIGKMYWTDWNRLAPKIEVANMDGTMRSIFIQNDLSLPNNLAIDYEHHDLCWTDAGVKKIECVNLHGHNRRIIHSPNQYPFDLTIAGDFIYWTDWDIKFIQRINRNGGPVDVLEIPLGGNGKLYGIVTIPRHCPRVTNHCSINNGECKHICLPNGRGRTCACPDHGEVEDECNDIN